MADNYFDPDETTTSDTRSTDASKSGVRDAWDRFNSRPENGAALMQFGLAMMSPQPKGQGFLGGVAQSIGQAGEAATSNIKEQEAAQERESKQDERASTAEYRKKAGDAAIINANAYKDQTSQIGAGAAALRQQASFKFRTDAAFRKWAGATDILNDDTLLKVMQSKHPEIKSKADVINNPQFAREAYSLFSKDYNTEMPDADPAAPVASSQPARPGVSAPPGPPQPGPPPTPGARWYQGQWYVRGPDGSAVPYTAGQ